MSDVLGDFKVLDLLQDARFGESARDHIYMSNIRLIEFLKFFRLGQDAHLFQNKQKIWKDVASITCRSFKDLGFKLTSRKLFLCGAFTKFFAQFELQPVIAVLTDLSPDCEEFKAICLRMEHTIVTHREPGAAVFDRYDVFRIQKVSNARRSRYYDYVKERIEYETKGAADERSLYHGSIFINDIIENGYDVRLANRDGFFGSGIYLAMHSSKSNLYVYGGEAAGCPVHNDSSCTTCPRQILINQVVLGKHVDLDHRVHLCHASPFCHSVIGKPTTGPDGLEHTEFVVYRDEQVLPSELVHYRLVKD